MKTVFDIGNALILLYSLGLAAWLTNSFRDPSSHLYMLDHPNHRSLHVMPTPRSGGIAIFAAVASGFAFLAFRSWYSAMLKWSLLALILVAIISFFDDRGRASVQSRLVVHFAAAALVLLDGFTVSGLILPGVAWQAPIWIGNVATVLFLVWLVNLYNFMDGMDGFAGGMTVIGFGAYACMGWQSGNEPFFMSTLVISAAAMGFLVFNFPPAKIFMGDVGSSTLGFLAGVMALWGVQAGVFPFWIPLLIFSPFVVDATVTLLRRMFKGEKVWQAHRTHYYQRLVRAGWSHKRTVLWEYAFMIGATLSALWVHHKPIEIQWFILGSWLALYVSVAVGIRYLEMRQQNHETLA